MLHGSFTRANFPEAVRRDVLDALLNYLAAIGLILSQTLEAVPGTEPGYVATSLGKVVFARFGAACLVHSYGAYFEQLADILVGDAGCKPAVDRAKNVLGSGLLHARKFFPAAYEMLATRDFDRFADVGCGDGSFLAGLHHQFPDASLVGVDISVVAIDAMKSRFQALPDNTVRGIVADAFDVESWADALGPDPRASVVSFWFVIHEFTQSSVARAVEFFTTLHNALPSADLIVGEIVKVPPDILATSHATSIMPEYILFHALSNQGLLTWQQFQEVLASIPYDLEREARFDELPSPSGRSSFCPSAFIWHLRPR